MDLITPTTELEAVNAVLQAVGETPINTLDNLGFTDASIARETLRAKSRETQSKGWYFNTDYNYTFTPNISGEVVLPPNVLSTRPCNAESRRIVPRAGKLYNADEGTYIFPLDAPPIREVVWGFPFEELPEAARRYIVVRGATQFQAQYQGSEQSYTFTKDDEKFALMALIEEHSLYEPKSNMFNDSVDVSEVFTR